MPSSPTYYRTAGNNLWTKALGSLVLIAIDIGLHHGCSGSGHGCRGASHYARPGCGWRGAHSLRRIRQLRQVRSGCAAVLQKRGLAPVHRRCYSRHHGVLVLILTLKVKNMHVLNTRNPARERKLRPTCMNSDEIISMFRDLQLLQKLCIPKSNNLNILDAVGA